MQRGVVVCPPIAIHALEDNSLDKTVAVFTTIKLDEGGSVREGVAHLEFPFMSERNTG
jgi:hypothetical protein